MFVDEASIQLRERTACRAVKIQRPRLAGSVPPVFKCRTHERHANMKIEKRYSCSWLSPRLQQERMLLYRRSLATVRQT